MIELPKRTNTDFQLLLLKAIAARSDGIAIAEEIRPEIEKALNLYVPQEREREWLNELSWTLIYMGPTTKDGKGKQWLSCPFGNPGLPPTWDEQAWLRENRPGFKPKRIWQITKTGRAELESTGLETVDQRIALWRLGKEEEEKDSFEPEDRKEARERTLRSIVLRRGQLKFRQKLIKKYRRCVISGCDAEDALEAAHIQAYASGGTNRLSNGLLLRADLHTLFDLGLLFIDPETLTVRLASSLSRTTYQEYEGKPLRVSREARTLIDRELLKEHAKLHNARQLSS